MSEPRLDRRRLLVRGGLLAGATTLAGAGGYAAARAVAGDEDGAGPAAAARGDAEFLLDPEYANLTTFLLASHPRAVREAI